MSHDLSVVQREDHGTDTVRVREYIFSVIPHSNDNSALINAAAHAVIHK